MAAERTLAFSPDVSGVHRLELGDVEQPRDRPSLRVIELQGRTPPAPGIGESVPTDLGAPELYLNRELTYLNFCWRVLHEAEDDRVPLLEYPARPAGSAASSVSSRTWIGSTSSGSCRSGNSELRVEADFTL